MIDDDLAGSLLLLDWEVHSTLIAKILLLTDWDSIPKSIAKAKHKPNLNAQACLCCLAVLLKDIIKGKMMK